MEIQIKGTPTHFDKVEPGDTFNYEGSLYIKPDEEIDCSGINLDDGSKIDVDKNAIVQVVNCIATIHP